MLSTFIDYFAGVVALAYFLMIAAATKQHFVSEKYSLGMNIISVLSLVGIFSFLAHAFFNALDYSLAALLIQALAFALFIWAVKHSAKKKLSLAFDSETRVDGIITSGPWKYIRHPFYASYLLFWLACALSTAHISLIVVFATLFFIYAYSAVQEERALQSSRHRKDYLEYRKNAGFLLPRFVARN